MLTNIISTNLSYFRPRGDLGRLMLSGVSRKVAVTLIHLFSPVYVFITLNESGIHETYAVLFVLVYFFLTFLIKILTQIISEDLSRKIGFKAVIRLSVLPFLLFVLMLVFASEYPILFLIAAVFSGIHAGLFWWGYHGYFVKKGEMGRFGQRIGEANLLETVAGVITPILGAFVTFYLGFPLLFVFSSVFMIVSLMLLGKGSRTRQTHDVDILDVVSLIKTHKSISLSYLAMGGEAVVSAVVWPMFLFLFFRKIVSLGLIVSLAALLASFFAVTIGAWTDRQGERRVVSLGSPILFISWVIRLLSFSFPAFVIGDSLRNFGQRMTAVPLNALSYKKAQEAGSARAILFLEITQTGGILISLFIIFLLILLGNDISVSFMIASFLSLLPLIAVVNKKLRDVYD